MVVVGEDGRGEGEDDEMEKEIEETTQRTKEAIKKIVNVRLSAAQPKNVPTQSRESKFIKYKPSQQSAAFNSGAKERIIRMVEMPVDPLELPKFKHKQVPRASGSPPVRVMQSLPRPVTVEDQQDRKIPPRISNWKNPKGYRTPLHKRLAADGRGLQDVLISNKFAKLSETLDVVEQKAREAVAMRSKVRREMMMEKERKEQELRALALRARLERTGIAPALAAAPAPSSGAMMEGFSDDMRADQHEGPIKESEEEREQRLDREKIREERRQERERERRLEAKGAAMGRKSKITRDRDRDIMEKVALGMANTGEVLAGGVMYDQMPFNQDKGMDSGFTDDLYVGAEEQLEKVLMTERFKPDKAFCGTSERLSGSKRQRRVEFEKQEENDPFGLEEFLSEVKKGKKAMEKFGGGGTMKASGGGSSFRDTTREEDPGGHT